MWAKVSSGNITSRAAGASRTHVTLGGGLRRQEVAGIADFYFDIRRKRSDPVLTIATCNVKSKGQQDVIKKEEARLIRTPHATLKAVCGNFKPTL